MAGGRYAGSDRAGRPTLPINQSINQSLQPSNRERPVCIGFCFLFYFFNFIFGFYGFVFDFLALAVSLCPSARECEKEGRSRCCLTSSGRTDGTRLFPPRLAHPMRRAAPTHHIQRTATREEKKKKKTSAPLRSSLLYSARVSWSSCGLVCRSRSSVLVSCGNIAGWAGLDSKMRIGAADRGMRDAVTAIYVRTYIRTYVSIVDQTFWLYGLAGRM